MEQGTSPNTQTGYVPAKFEFEYDVRAIAVGAVVGFVAADSVLFALDEPYIKYSDKLYAAEEQHAAASQKSLETHVPWHLPAVEAYGLAPALMLTGAAIAVLAQNGVRKVAHKIKEHSRS